MPAYSTLRTFVKSLQTGQTNITDTLDKLLSDQPALRSNRNWLTFKNTPNLLDNPVPAWLRALLKANGMRDIEIDHIDQHWPPDEKEKARQWIAYAIDHGQPLTFNWELHEGKNAINVQRNAGARIVFLSPRDGVRISGLAVWYVHIGGVSAKP